MKILMLNYEYPPLGGGTGIANQYLLKEFKKQKNLSVTLLTSSTDKYQVEKLAKNTEVIKLDVGKKGKNQHHQSSLNLMLYFIKSTVWVMKHKDNYDLIHAFAGLPGGITAWLTKKPYIISLRGGDEPGYEPRFEGILQRFKPLLKRIYTKAKSVDANSQWLKNLALKSFPNLKIKVIRNGVDLKNFYPAKKIVKQPIILCTSRFGQRKGVEYLVKAMPEVLKTIPQAKLWLVGEGAEKEKLKTGKGIKFLGRLGHKQLGSIYRKAQVFVLPSLSESSSNSLLEAMGCGLAVVVTKVGGNTELIDKNNGLLVPVADSKALAKAIIELLNNQQQRNKMRVSSLKKAERLKLGLMTKAYLKLYA